MRQLHQKILIKMTAHFLLIRILLQVKSIPSSYLLVVTLVLVHLIVAERLVRSSFSNW